MKKMVYLIMSCFVLYVIFGVMISQTNAEADVSNKTTIYVNDIEISSCDMIPINDNEVVFPLRAVIEALGSEVLWEESTGNVYFSYADIEYICKFVALNSHFPERKNILVCKLENRDSIINSDYIQLNPMSADGAYFILNDRTYLHQETGRRLFEALGCKVEIESDTHTIRINQM